MKQLPKNMSEIDETNKPGTQAEATDATVPKVTEEPTAEETDVNLESEEIRKYPPKKHKRMMNTLSLPLISSEDNRFCNTDTNHSKSSIRIT